MISLIQAKNLELIEGKEGRQASAGMGSSVHVEIVMNRAAADRLAGSVWIDHVLVGDALTQQLHGHAGVLSANQR